MNGNDFFRNGRFRNGRADLTRFDRAVTMALTSFKQSVSSKTKLASGWQLAAIIALTHLPPAIWYLLPVGIVALIIAERIWRRILPLRERVRLAKEENDRRQRKSRQPSAERRPTLSCNQVEGRDDIWPTGEVRPRQRECPVSEMGAETAQSLTTRPLLIHLGSRAAKFAAPR
jgi:hypothetical protein